MKKTASVVLFAISIWSSAAWTQGSTDKVSLQIFVDQHIESLMVNGRIMFIDFDNLKSVSSVPVDNHPLMFRGDGFYVACITLLDEEGKEYPVDLYIYEHDGKLTVSDITFGEAGREDFRRLAKSGAVEKL